MPGIIISHATALSGLPAGALEWSLTNKNSSGLEPPRFLNHVPGSYESNSSNVDFKLADTVGHLSPGAL